MKYFAVPLLLALLAGCAAVPKPEIPAVVPPVVVPPTTVPTLTPTTWEAVTGWRDEPTTEAWPAFLESCAGLKNQPSWQAVCQIAQTLPAQDGDAQRAFFEGNFVPHQLANPDNSTEGMVTGYYEPLLRGSLQATKKYRYPVYGVPDDLLIVDLASVYPELKSLRLRGRLEGKRVVPYYNRAEIDNGAVLLKGKEIAWVDNAVELFFLQIQGSGRIKLENGDTLRVGYADQNGYPYQSIGRLLVERGELPLEKASMHGIKEWGKQNPDKLPELLASNPSYVFFRALPNNLAGPLGALGVPLTAERSIAVDPRAVPLGAPVFLATTWPNSSKPLQRLMLAQDTGGAIKGGVRADFFWGFGDEAGAKAGSMKQRGRMWVLLPKSYPVKPSLPN